MKKIMMIPFALFYVSFNIGMVVNYHFCYNAFRGLTLIVSPGTCCDSDCAGCHNSSYELTISGDYDYPAVKTFIIAQPVSTVQHPDVAGTLLFHKGQGQYPRDTGPWIQSGGRSIYLAIRTLRI